MTWETVKLGEICTIEKGNIGITKAIPGEYPLVSLAEELKSHNEYQFDDEAVVIPLVSSTGHASMKRIFFQSGKFSVGSILCAVIPKDKSKLSAEFLYRYLDFNKERKLVLRMKGMANVSLPMKAIAEVEIPLPPIEHQIDLIEEFQILEDANIEITTELSHQLELVSRHRQAFLREAMQGKLVPQDERDEPAAVLLEKIKIEKEKLIAEKKIKKQKPLPEIKPEEIPFEIPNNWTWCRLGEIIEFSDNLNIHSVFSDEILINYVDIDAIDNQRFEIREVKEKPVSQLSIKSKESFETRLYCLFTCKTIFEQYRYCWQAGRKTHGARNLTATKYYISSELQASVLSEKDLAVAVTKTGGKAFLEKDFDERFAMTLDKALADLPADIRAKIKQVDAKTLLSAIVVGVVAIAAMKKLPGEATILIGSAVTLAQLLKYEGDASHIADKIGNSVKPGDLPVEELKELITNGGLDLLLAGVGYAGERLAPKIGSGALKLTDQAAEVFAAASRKTQSAAHSVANQIDDLLIPEMVTPEGITLKPLAANETKGANVLEMRGDYRINVRKGNGKTGTGMDYAWRRHGINGNPINKSTFSISRAEAEALLQQKNVIQTPAVFDAKSGNYIREIDVGKIIGQTPLKQGGHQTSVVTVITDEAGNLVNYFPGRMDYGATLP